VNNNPYKSAVEHLKFDEAFDEQTIALMIAAAKRKKAIRPFQIPKSSWRYIAAAAVIALLFIAVPLIRGPQNTNETTVAAAMTAAGYETETSIKNDPAETTEVVFKGSPMLISDINKLISFSDVIIVGKVNKALPVVRIDAVALGLVKGIPELEENVSCYQIRIDQVVKGDFAPGDTIRVDMLGGLAEGINEIYEDLQFPSEGSTYLMFIEKTDRTEENKYFLYRFVGTFDGFSEIVDGKIVPQKNTSIFKSGTLINEVITTVSGAIENS